MKNASLAAIILLMIGFGNLRADSGEQPQVMMNGMAVTDISVSSAAVSWITDQKTSSDWVEIRPADKDSVTTIQDKYHSPHYVHYVEITDLQPGVEYLFRFGSDTGTWDNQGEWYPFTTLQNTAPVTPMAILCLTLDTYGSPLERVLVRVRAVQEGREPSLPRTVLTAGDGYWNTTYTDLRASDGTLYGAGAGNLLIVEYLVNYWSTYTDSSAVLSGSSPQILNQVNIPVFDPSLGTKGDLDGDGAINIFDLLEILEILSGQTAPPLDDRLFFASDLDSSGSVNIMDLLALLQILSSLS